MAKIIKTTTKQLKKKLNQVNYIQLMKQLKLLKNYQQQNLMKVLMLVLI